MSGSVFGIRIQIHKAPEYGSNTDPDPRHWFIYMSNAPTFVFATVRVVRKRKDFHNSDCIDFIFRLEAGREEGTKEEIFSHKTLR